MTIFTQKTQNKLVYYFTRLIKSSFNYSCDEYISILKILILGCGSIGSRHAKNLKKIGIKQIVLCDKNQLRLKYLGKKISSKLLYSNYIEAIKEHPDISAAILCTPTAYHIKQAIYFSQRKINLFIEKPLSHNLKGIKLLQRIVSKNNLTVMMGHAFIFDPGFQKIKSLLSKKIIGKVYFATYIHGQFLPDWHPSENYRNEYTAKKELGGGVLLTLGSHTFYLIEWLFGQITNVNGSLVERIGSLKINVDDCFLFLVKTENDIIVQTQNNFIAKIYNHKMIIEGEKGTIEYDFINKEIKIIYEKNNVKSIKIKQHTNDRYVLEMKYFLNHISKKSLDKNLDLASGLRFLTFVNKLT